MTVVTTRPTASTLLQPDPAQDPHAFPTATGAASVHAALAPTDSDSSYVTFFQGDGVDLTIAQPTAPSGAVQKRISVRARTMSSGAFWTSLRLGTAADSNRYGGSVSGVINWVTPTTTTIRSVDTSTAPGADLHLYYESAVGNFYLYEVYVDTLYVEKPVTNPTAPTGTLTNTNTPIAAWTNTLDSDGGAQTRRQVKIFTSAQYGAYGFDPSSSYATHDSGVQDSASASYAITTPLANATYRLYVRVGQTVNGSTHWSDWAYEGFVVNVTPPNAPSITATGEDDDGRIKIDLDDAASGPSTDLFEIEKSADGVTWESMRVLLDNGRVTPASGLATVYDYEAVNGVTTYYRARALHSYSGVHAASSWATDDGRWESPGWWLKHPTRPALNVQITVYSAPGYSRAARQGVFNVAGRNLPVVVDGVRGGKTGSLVLDVETAEERAAIEALLDEGVSLLLQGREDDNWEDIWVRFANQESSRQIDKAYVEATFESLPWTEVERPSGVIVEWPA